MSFLVQVQLGEFDGNLERLNVALVLTLDDFQVLVRLDGRRLGAVYGDLLRLELLLEAGIVQRHQHVALLHLGAFFDDPFDLRGDGRALGAGFDVANDVVVVRRLQRAALDDAELKRPGVNDVRGQVHARRVKSAAQKRIARAADEQEQSHEGADERKLRPHTPAASLRKAGGGADAEALQEGPRLVGRGFVVRLGLRHRHDGRSRRRHGCRMRLHQSILHEGPGA
jgi:hypothetical protein